MPKSRAGRSGGSWYGSYDVYVGWRRVFAGLTNLEWAKREARALSKEHGIADIRVYDCDTTQDRVIMEFKMGKKVSSP